LFVILLADMPTGQDTDLVSRFKRGDTAAFDELFALHKDGVYSLVTRTVGPAAAEDLCQEVFVHLFRSLGGFRGDSSLQTWLYRITMNVCVDHLRRKSRQPQTSPASETEDLPDDSLHPYNEVGRWTESEIRQAIRALPQAERTVVEMRFIQDMSYKEVSRAVGAPVGTVKARVHRAVAKLRDQLRTMQEGDKP